MCTAVQKGSYPAYPWSNEATSLDYLPGTTNKLIEEDNIIYCTVGRSILLLGFIGLLFRLSASVHNRISMVRINVKHNQKMGDRPIKIKNLALVGFTVLAGIVIGSSLSRNLSDDYLNPLLDLDGSIKSEPLAVQVAVAHQVPKNKVWSNWPAVAYEEVGHPLVTKGDSFSNQARELYFQKQANGKTLMDEFVEVYNKRPDPVNMCGIRINHAMALFLAVKQIQPSLVIESGVNAGVSTYFIRAASSTTKIFAIDPEEKPICNQGDRWIDPSDKTTNYTGKKFVDLMDLDWKGMVARNEIDPDSTLVFLDDHLHAFKRIAGVMKLGVRHIVVEDNYKLHEGTCIIYVCVYIMIIKIEYPNRTIKLLSFLQL
jgi:hypothetical protein